MEFGITGVAAVTALCYLVGLVIRVTRLDNKFIPLACGVVGVLLGLVSFYGGMVDFPAADPVTAAAVGAVSGLAATGLDQVRKQLKNG